MLEIINNIPSFVWPLFTILLISGLKARKTQKVPLAILLLIPSIFFIWSVMSYFENYSSNPIAIVAWIICLILGFFIGFTHMQKQNLKFDHTKSHVEIPGSLLPLMLSMSIFTSKFSLGMLSSILPHLNGSFLFIAIELFSSVILGIFAGRALNCFKRYQAFSKDLQKKI